MKRNLLILVVTITGFNLFGQSYTFKVYHGTPAYNGVASGVAYSVPDAGVTGIASLVGSQAAGLDCRNFDQVSPSTSVSLFSEDFNVTCGLNEGAGTDAAGGSMIRGWSWAFADFPQYAPLTWNASPNTFRKGGGWYYYTVNFKEAGSYSMFLRVRGLTPNETNQVYTITFYSKTNTSSPLLTINSNLNGMVFNTTTTGDPVNIGSMSTDGSAVYVADAKDGSTGQAGSEWVRFTTTVEITNPGELVVKISHAGTTANASLGAFTFIKDWVTGVETRDEDNVRLWLDSQNRLRTETPLLGRLTVYNIAGRPVSDFNVSGIVDKALSVTPGIYIVRYSGNDGFARSQKIVVK